MWFRIVVIISIPYGAIKSIFKRISPDIRTHISIPYGAIKRQSNSSNNSLKSISIPYGAIKRQKKNSLLAK